MKYLILSVATIGLLGIASAPSAQADQWDKKTILTVNETIQVPNKVLPPGTYVFKLMDSSSNRHIVQIFNGDERHLETTVLAIPNYRLQPTGKSAFTFWETPPGQPKAMRAWFYPGDNFGQEFAYPKRVAVELAANVQTAAPAPAPEPPQAEAAPAPAPEPEPTPAPEPQEQAQSTPPAQPEATPAPAPAPPAQQPSELPKTASLNPLLGLAGLGSLATFLVLRAARTS